jgi:hypothetical protein
VPHRPAARVGHTRVGHTYPVQTTASGGRQFCQQYVGFLEALLRAEREREGKPRLEPPTAIHRGDRQALGEERIRRRPGAPGRGGHQLRRSRHTPFETPCGEPQQILSPPRAGIGERGGKPGCERGLRTLGPAEHLAVEWMYEPGINAPIAALERDQVAALKPLSAPFRDQPIEQQRPDRLSERDQLQRFPVCRRELADTRSHDLRDPRPRIERAAPAPDTVGRSERPSLEAVAHELVQEQRVPARCFPQSEHGRAFDLAVERQSEQPPHLRLGEGLQLDVMRESVLPQRQDRISDRLARANGGY